MFSANNGTEKAKETSYLVLDVPARQNSRGAPDLFLLPTNEEVGEIVMQSINRLQDTIEKFDKSKHVRVGLDCGLWTNHDTHPIVDMVGNEVTLPDARVSNFERLSPESVVLVTRRSSHPRNQPEEGGNVFCYVEASLKISGQKILRVNTKKFNPSRAAPSKTIELSLFDKM